jgi:predicted transcriptional regulator
MSRSTMLPRNVSSVVPRLVFGLDPKILQSLSRSQRRVLVLIDGRRSIEKIFSILSSQDIQGILKTLRELEAMGLIVLER